MGAGLVDAGAGLGVAGVGAGLVDAGLVDVGVDDVKGGNVDWQDTSGTSTIDVCWSSAGGLLMTAVDRTVLYNTLSDTGSVLISADTSQMESKSWSADGVCITCWGGSWMACTAAAMSLHTIWHPEKYKTDNGLMDNNYFLWLSAGTKMQWCQFNTLNTYDN